VVAGKSLEAAIYAMEELEETAKLHLLLRGLNPRALTRAQVDELVRVFNLDHPNDGGGEDHEHGDQR
jgi:ribulose-5-phosphate 4-epimerase/fuculose-1-phosphate aldolase